MFYFRIGQSFFSCVTLSCQRSSISSSTNMVSFILLCSATMSARQIRSDDRAGGARSLPEVTGDFSTTTDTTRAGGAIEHLRYEHFALYLKSHWQTLESHLALQATFTDNSQISCDFSSMAVTRRRIICSWATTSIAVNNRWRPFACCSRTKSNIRRISSCCAAITSALASIEFTVSILSALLLGAYLN